MTDRRTFLASAAGLFLTGSAMGALGHNLTGQKSDTLDINALMQPIQPRSILRDPDWFIWGGGMVRTADGVCHMLFARWPRKEGFNAWVTHSEIAHATSNDPLGPWTVTARFLIVDPAFGMRTTCITR